jgi:hypothetical protein
LWKRTVLAQHKTVLLRIRYVRASRCQSQNERSPQAATIVTPTDDRAWREVQIATLAYPIKGQVRNGLRPNARRSAVLERKRFAAKKKVERSQLSTVPSRLRRGLSTKLFVKIDKLKYIKID